MIPRSDPEKIRAWQARSKPLGRFTELRAISPKAATGDGAAVVLALPQRNRSRDTGFSRSVKLQCRTRAGSGDAQEAACEACAVWLGPHMGEVQHRDARGMGGTSLEVTNSIVNAVLLCGSGALGTGCHGAAERRLPDLNGRGFWLRNGEHPAETPIMLASVGGSGITVYLTADGTYSPYPPAGAIA